ncbi:MAG: carbamate kinase [Oscillospiraceae bacterium]|nr:carbamate kinase [Oscillospiraceae bacterium]
MSTIVIALGGNALQKKGDNNTAENQMRRVHEVVDFIFPIIAAFDQVVITHGNGPQIGRVLLQNEAAQEITPALTMDMCSASVQGAIGYQIQTALDEAFKRGGSKRRACTLVTRVLVSHSDPAFLDPTKPIGPFYTYGQAQALHAQKGWAVAEDAAGRGWRRIVPSPHPLKIVELDSIRRLSEDGTVVIAGGGGGIPVAEINGGLRGIDAVIDKDLASGLLADEIGADVLLILTEVENVYVDFGKTSQRPLGVISADALAGERENDEFARGSMLPKVDAAIEFVRGGDARRAIITCAAAAQRAIEGAGGTIVHS